MDLKNFTATHPIPRIVLQTLQLLNLSQEQSCKLQNYTRYPKDRSGNFHNKGTFFPNIRL